MLLRFKTLDASQNNLTKFSALNKHNFFRMVISRKQQPAKSSYRNCHFTKFNSFKSCNNKLSSNFGTLSSLTKLEQLWLNHNEITAFPTEVLALPQLMSLSFCRAINLVETFQLIFQKFATFLTTDLVQQKFRIFSIKTK